MFDNCDVKSCGIINSFKRKFGCNVDIKRLEWKVLLDHLSDLKPEVCENHNKKLLESTVNNEKFLKYPIKISYQKAFLKHFIQQTTDNNISCECVFDVYASLLIRADDDQENCFKHYLVGDKNIIIKENRNFISGGTTGLCSWEAGKALANWSFCQTKLFKDKTVIELGCGSGLTGLAIVKSLSPQKYIFTDCHPLVLNQLKHNLNINIAGEDWRQKTNSTIIDVFELNWEEAVDNNLECFKEADLIIGADIVYDKDLIPPLCSILEKLLDNNSKCAVIACTIRNPETIDSFIASIKSKGLTLQQDTSTYPIVIEEAFSSPVYIYLIKK